MITHRVPRGLQASDARTPARAKEDEASPKPSLLRGESIVAVLMDVARVPVEPLARRPALLLGPAP